MMRWAAASLLLPLLTAAPGVRAADAAGTSGEVVSGDAIRALHARRDRLNAGIVGIVADGIDGTDLRAATELATVLDGAKDGLRVFPVAGKGSVQNVEDVLLARGIDLGIVQSDVLAYYRRERPLPRVDERVQYVAKLYDQEIHILAARDIRSLEDLAFRKVNFDAPGSGTELTANLVLGTLGIPVEATRFDAALALEKLRRGEIAALIHVAGKPARLFQGIAAEEGLHFLSLASIGDLNEIYAPARLTTDDYPSLVPSGERIDTLAVGSVMAAYAWPIGSERHRKVARFIDAFFDRLATLQAPPRHPKWRSVDVAAAVPGWTRFPAAEAWLEGHRQHAALAPPDSAAPREAARDADTDVAAIFAPGRREDLFRDFLAWRGQPSPTVAAAEPITAEREALFRDFLAWRGQRNTILAAAAPIAAERDAIFRDFLAWQQRHPAASPPAGATAEPDVTLFRDFEAWRPQTAAAAPAQPRALH
jgi:TRAP transporter TAXI family solute receptor